MSLQCLNSFKYLKFGNYLQALEILISRNNDNVYGYVKSLMILRKRLQSVIDFLAYYTNY